MKASWHGSITEITYLQHDNFLARIKHRNTNNNHSLTNFQRLNQFIYTHIQFTTWTCLLITNQSKLINSNSTTSLLMQLCKLPLRQTGKHWKRRPPAKLENARLSASSTMHLSTQTCNNFSLMKLVVCTI